MPVYYIAESQNFSVRMTIKSRSGKDRKLTRNGFPTRAAAESWERKRNERNDLSNLTLRDYVAGRYLPSIREKVSGEVLNTKQIIFRKHVFPYLGNMRVSDITREHIERWHEWLRKQKDRNGKPLKNSYLICVHSVLSAAFNAADSALTPRGNTAKACGNFRAGRKRLRWWTIPEYRKFSSRIENPLFRAAFDLLFWTGIKEGEVLALECGDYRKDEKTLFVHATLKRDSGKTRAEETSQLAKRTVPLPDFMASQLDELTEGRADNERIFAGISKTSLIRIFGRTAAEAGLPKITVNDLRTSNVRILAELGVSIIDMSRLLGNKPSNIMRYYAPFFSDNGTSIAEKINQIH